MMSHREKIICLYFEEKARPVDIARELGISKSAVTQVLKKDERYLQEKNIRKINNQQKHRQYTEDYIKNTRSVKQFGNSVDKGVLDNLHRQDVAELSYKNKLTDMAYRNWNVSAFTYDENKKQFAFREELGRSADVPKYIKVEV